MADYKVLSQEEQDEIITSFLHAQERDLFCHQLNLDRYNKMLETLAEGPWKNQITKLRDETASRLDEAKNILEGTKSQLPPPARLESAKTRLKNAGRI